MSLFEHMLAECVVRICSMRHVQYVRFPSLQLVCWSRTLLFWPHPVRLFFVWANETTLGEVETGVFKWFWMPV